MKFLPLAAAVVFAIPALAQTNNILTYSNFYDDSSLSLNEVACSNGANGLVTKGYTTLGSLPSFPNLGGVYAVTGWNSSACGTCWNVTYDGKTLSILAVDTSGNGFDVSEEAMNTLTGGLAAQLGSVKVTSTQVNASFCGL